MQREHRRATILIPGGTPVEVSHSKIAHIRPPLMRHIRHGIILRPLHSTKDRFDSLRSGDRLEVLREVRREIDIRVFTPYVVTHALSE